VCLCICIYAFAFARVYLLRVHGSCAWCVHESVCTCIFYMCVCVCVCVCVWYVCVCVVRCVYMYLFSFINYEISYTIDIIPIHEGEGIPIGGDRIGYTYTLTPIIKLSYFLFNRYKTTIALPWFSSALLFLHSYALSRYARVFLSLFLFVFHRFVNYICFSIFLLKFFAFSFPLSTHSTSVHTHITITTSCIFYSSLSAPLIIIYHIVSRQTIESYVPLEH